MPIILIRILVQYFYKNFLQGLRKVVWVVRDSEGDGTKLVLKIIVGVEGSGGLEEVSCHEWEGILEQEIRSLLEWNASKGVPVGFVASSQLFRESFVSIVSQLTI
jgi:hypothetical protein